LKKWMIDSIMEAPETCRNLYEKRDKYVSKLTDIYLAKPYKEIVMVASGSSFNIASCSKYAMEAYLNVRVTCINSVTYAKYDYKFHEDALIICMSQSGKSTNTIDAVKKAKEWGNDVVAISMHPGSPISQYCENVLEYGTYGPGDDVFVCRGVPSSTLFFILFALEAGLKSGTYPQDKYDKRMAEIDRLIDEMPIVREKCKAFYEANKEDFYSMKRVMTTGIGPAYGVATEGALKIEETIGIPSNSYETEEFLHGPVYEVKKDHAVFIVDLDHIMHDRNMQIYEATKELTDRVYLITNSPGYSGKNVLNIDFKACSFLLPMLFVIPFQFISSFVCDDLRITAITVYNHRFSQIVKTKA